LLKIAILSTFLLLSNNNYLFTQEENEEELYAIYQLRVVKKIIIVGNLDTDTDQIINFLYTKEGEIFKANKFAKDLQRLRNTSLFYRVKAKLKPISVNDLEITLLVEDRWTLLPIISFDTSVPKYEVGLYDLNFLGQMFEIGGSYKNEQEQNYYSFWYLDQSFLGTKVPLSFIIFRSGVIDTYYDLNNPNREIAKFKHVANGGFIESGRNVYDNFRWLLRYTWYSEKIERQSGGTLLPIDDSQETLDLWNQIEDEQRKLMTIKNSSNLISGLLTLNFIFGHLNIFDNYIIRGWEIQMVISHSDTLLGSFETYNQSFIMGRYFFSLADFNIGMRLCAASKTTRNLNYDFSLGGFILNEVVTGQNTTSGTSTLRGFNPTQFHGNNFYYGTFELRYPLIDSDDVPFLQAVVIQTTAFVDYGYIWNGSFYNHQKTFKDIYASSGAGATFILKKVANAMLRFQIAIPLNPMLKDYSGNPEFKIIFGSTQHF